MQVMILSGLVLLQDAMYVQDVLTDSINHVLVDST